MNYNIMSEEYISITKFIENGNNKNMRVMKQLLPLPNNKGRMIEGNFYANVIIIKDIDINNYKILLVNYFYDDVAEERICLCGLIFYKNNNIHASIDIVFIPEFLDDSMDASESMEGEYIIQLSQEYKNKIARICLQKLEHINSINMNTLLNNIDEYIELFEKID